jgi:hypothetical protein
MLFRIFQLNHSMWRETLHSERDILTKLEAIAFNCRQNSPLFFPSSSGVRE